MCPVSCNNNIGILYYSNNNDDNNSDSDSDSDGDGAATGAATATATATATITAIIITRVTSDILYGLNKHRFFKIKNDSRTSGHTVGL